MILTAVVGRKFVTPSRSRAASLLASRQLGPRPGLSAGISGTGFDTASMSSQVSSIAPYGQEGATASQGPVHKEILSRHTMQKPAQPPAKHKYDHSACLFICVI